MARAPQHRRASRTIRPGVITPWPVDMPSPTLIAQRATYRASPEHKNYRAPNGEWTFLIPRPDKAFCMSIPPAQWPRVQDALRIAITSGCVSEEFQGDFPRRAWVYINGVLHEARLTNAGIGEYHGFPLTQAEHYPSDPQHLLQRAPRVSIP